ncbi:HNH endonuclease [Roseinatronobacter sp.]|uniref:HNH endonuclease n=1 Tax=Roseinatronobacter sp. TaxID=1945755 RepID=UPI003F718E61
MSDKSTLTAERLRHLLDYDLKTGVFTWRVQRGSRVKPGDIAGTPNEKGYIVIRIDGKQYRAHRLAFLHKDGEWPEGKQVDHRNGTHGDNRWDNLRVATPSQNQWNRGQQRNNTSGYRGVSFDKTRRKWVAYIRVNGRSRRLGRFPTARKASAAYEAEAQRIRGEYYRPPSAA